VLLPPTAKAKLGFTFRKWNNTMKIENRLGFSKVRWKHSSYYRFRCCAWTIVSQIPFLEVRSLALLKATSNANYVSAILFYTL
jgi:hypothetical protein